MRKNNDSSNFTNIMNSASMALGALLFSLFIGALVILLSGYSPIEVYRLIFEGALGSSRGFFLSLREATPLLFTGLAFAIAFKVGIINVGAEGQLLLGGLSAALAGAYITFLPVGLHLIVCILIGAIAGGLVGVISATLKVYFNAHEAITCIMLNSIIGLFINYLCNGPLKPQGATTPQTKEILETAHLPKIVPMTQLTYGLLIAVAIAIILNYVIEKTVFGYEIKVVGMNQRAAKVAGIKISRLYIITFFISGALAGLAGADITLGILHKNIDPISVGLGFEGISVAALGMYNPIGIILSSALFGILKAGAMQVNRISAVPFEFVKVIQVMIIIAVTAPNILKLFVNPIKKSSRYFRMQKKESNLQ